MAGPQISRLIKTIRERLEKASAELVFYPDDHRYEFRGNELVSVSQVCRQFAPQFDSHGNAKRISEQTGKPVEEILKSWELNSKRSCDTGTRTHNYAEEKFYKKTQFPVPADFVPDSDPATVPHKKAVDAFWDFLNNDFKSIKYIPVAAENKVMNLSLGYAGTFDLLALEVKNGQPNGLVIFDYKTNSNLFNVFKTETMLEPITDLYNCNAAHYSCQLALYQLALENIFPELPVVRRVLLWLDNEGASLIDENSRERFNDAGKKWKFLSPETIENLKNKFRFRHQKDFATLALPDIAQTLETFLNQK
ncbi:MAG: hypothetical protein K6B46_03695 [Opitutales bacterium]|nr:hypothetical protein [Opitutales bacterium]